MSDRTELWSYGGGTQSAAIAALIVAGRLPRPDAVVIADTERERSTTWRYLEEVVAPTLRRIDLDVVPLTSVEIPGALCGDMKLVVELCRSCLVYIRNEVRLLAKEEPTT